MSQLSKLSIIKRLFLRLCTSKTTCFCGVILLGYTLVACLVKAGWLAADWDVSVGESYEQPNWVHYFGTDILGRSVLYKVLHGVEIAMSVGFIVALFSVAIGVILGVLAGYFGGILDACIVWLYTVLCSIPTIILLLVVPFIMGKGMYSMCVSFVIVGWTETCRLIRGEVLRHKSREYIQAASAIGVSNFRKLFVHMLPNMFPLIIFQFSSVFQHAIKSEVTLSYLGLGIQHKPSWGVMINDAKTELLRGVWWELFFSALAMFFIILVFNILADKWRDSLDPKLKGQ